jgi:hypothetical protein
MAEFDMDAYLRRRPFNPNSTDRLQKIEEATQTKIQALNQFGAERQAKKEANKDSWVSQNDLDPDSFSGALTNLGAAATYGAGRFAGFVASLPQSINALVHEGKVAPEDWESYNRMIEGKATPEDMLRLQRDTNDSNAHAEMGKTTVLERITRGIESRQEARNINEKSNIPEILHNDKRQEFHKALGQGFDEKWGQVQQGVDALSRGEDGQGWGDVAAGVGKLAAGAGKAIANNPMAAIEYAVENAPQLLVGLAGKGGQVVMGASNAGYGADLFNQGVEKVQKDTGKMPTSEVRDEIGGAAIRAAAAEHASDMLGLALMKPAAKSLTESARTGFKQALLNVGKATTSGFASEGVTEGYQTYEEGNATLKPASAKDIYEGAVIGGVSGGTLSGGGRAAAELAQATPEHAAKRAQEEASTATFVENAKANNAEAYLDEASKEYDPAKGVAVLYANAQSADATPETKQQNVEKAHDIIADLTRKRGEIKTMLDELTPEGIQSQIDTWKTRLQDAPDTVAPRIEARIAELQEQKDSFDPKSVDPKVVKALKTQLTTLDRHLTESTKLRDQLAVDTAPKEDEVTAAVEKADVTFDASKGESDTAAKAAVDHVVSLAMAHPDSFSDDHLNRLVSNPNNGLSEVQRTFLRTMSQSRIAENALKSMGTVANEVINGDPAKNQLGIKDYRQRMQAAITSRDAEKAETALHMLGKFATGHTQKLRFFMEQFKGVGSGAVNVVPTKQGWALAPSQDTSEEGRAAIRDLGGVTIHGGSGKLISQVENEVKALNAAQEQLKASYSLRFEQPASVPPVPVAQTAVEQPGSAVAVDSSIPIQAQGTAPVTTPVEKPVTTQSTQGQTQSKVDSTVDQTTESTKPKKARQRIEPKDYQNIVGAILRVTGGEGISSKTARDLMGDSTKHLKNIRPSVRVGGWNDVGRLIEYLREQEGYSQLNTEQDLKDLLADHMNGIPGRPAEVMLEEEIKARERQAKAKDQAERREINAEAKAKGIKQARGKRTLDDVKADLAKWEEELSKLEAEEERLAIQAESAFFEANEVEAMEELAETVGYTPEEIENVRIENQESEERTAEATEGTTEESRRDRTDDGQTQEGEGTDGTAGKLSLFDKVVDITGKKFAEVFKSINLIAHNLVQKAGKGTGTKRPLVATKDFLSQWTKGTLDTKALEAFVGAPLLKVQESFLTHFRDTANGWQDVITKNLVKGQVIAGVKYLKEIEAAKGNKAALAEIEAKYKGKKPGDISYDENLRYTNPIQYLIELDDSGKANTEENVKTAIAAAAFMYVAENAKAPQFATPDAIKAMFGLSEYDTIGEKLMDKVSTLGTPERAAIISMGQRVTQALGLAPKKEATQEFLARLEADLGAHVMKLLVDTGVMERSTVTAAEISAGLKGVEGHNAEKQGDMFFLRMKRSEGKTLRDQKLNPTAERISDLAKGTQSIMSKLFGVEVQATEPSWEPIKATQRTTNNTNQAVPDELNKNIKHENSVANYVREDVWYLLQEIGVEDFLDMTGYEHPDETRMHKTTIKSIKASNEALRRELMAAIDYFGMLEKPVEEGGSTLGLKQPLYLSHSVWKQQRVGIDGLINPQSSKIHRWMLTRSDWLTTVNSTDTDMMDSFMLRVGEGLGVKTDKQGNVKSLPAVQELFNTKSEDKKTREKAEKLQAAVDALVRSRQGTTTKEDRAAIVAGVKAGGEKMHSMDALIAMAAYQDAKATAGVDKDSKQNPFSFDVQMMGEVDGVTNGPMLSHMMLGAAKDAKALLVRLNRGGFFQEGSGFYNYNVWRGEVGHTDLYESTIAAVIRHITQQGDKVATFDRLQKITGPLTNKDTGAVEKAGRNIIKTPLTAMLFGSSIKGAVDSMFRDFITKSYEGFEAIAKMKPEDNPEAALKAYVENLNDLLMEAKLITERLPQSGLDYFLTEFEFSDTQVKALEEVFKNNLGDSVKATMEAAYEQFLSMRDTINGAANATFSLYHAAYLGVRQKVINELKASGEIKAASRKVNGVLVEDAGDPLHDLTPAQEKLIQDRVAALTPVVHTYMSKQSKNSNESGLHISKSSRHFSQERAYQNVSRFGRAFQVEGGALTAANSAYQRIQMMPGVAMVPMMIHSLDSAISHIALMGRQVLNVHDAHGTGLKDFTKTAQALNKATWQALLGYSPAAEMRDSFKNTLLAMDDLLRTSDSKEAVLPEIQKKLKELGNSYATWVDGVKIPLAPEKVLIRVASQMFYAADKADRIKYEAMSQLQAIDQYALEGGHYEVKPEDRAEAARLLSKVGDGSVPGSVWAAIDRINEAALGIKVGPITSPYGVLGKSAIESDPELVRSFEDKGTQEAKDVIAQIKGKVSPANRVLLKKIEALVDPKFPVTMITARTKDGAAITKVMGARGWYSRDGDAAASYVLSPEFKMSGLTADLLLHELIHAALVKTVEYPNTKEAKELVASLDRITAGVVDYLNKPENAALKAKYPMKLNAHELVAWGMSDIGFQQDVLTQVPMTKSMVKDKRLMSAMMAFIKAISKFLGLPMTVKNENGQDVDNALSALIQDVSQLFEQAKNPDAGSSTDTFSAAMEAVQNMTTLDVFEALDEGKVSPTFSDHLRGLLEGISNKLHGPYGTFKELVESQMATTPKDLWDQAKGRGNAPFGSAALAVGIPMNDQVAFVLEQVEASVHGALEANTGKAHDVYVELSRLYQEARTKLANSQTLSPDLRDFLFKIDPAQGGKSRHLARFAALGLAHPEVNAALQMATERAPIVVSGSFEHRLEALFQKALEWFNGRLTHTYGGQPADAKLKALVTQLVQIEAKRKEPILQKASALDFVENSLKQGAANLKNKVEKAGQSSWVRNSKRTTVRLAGAVVSTVAGERTEAVMNHIQAIRDRQMNQGFGLTMGLINEIRGMNDGNKMFHRLIREAKLREGTREDIIVHTSNIALEGFANKGKDLTQGDKVAITAGLIRTDIAVLLDHHSMDEITALLTTPAALNSEIARLEKLLAAYPKAQGYYERYAKNLGYKLATGKVKGPHLMMNAANIASLAGTGMTSYVTKAQAAAATPIIDQLASLYAYRYTNPGHKIALANVLATEQARGNESGVEMVLKLHKALQQQSKERLFEGSEALMMKGYTPEIYDPKKEVLVATEAEGAKLEAQGFVKGKQVAYDPKDPDRNTERFVYKRDGGGLRPWLSGIISYTGETAKGSRSKTDNVQNLTEWKANKADLRRMGSEKRRDIQKEFRYDPSYDPSKVDDTFAAPILNAEGDVVDYRYLMSEENKDDLLNRDSRFEKVLGFFAGNIYDKESTKESNRKAIKALHEQYREDFATRSQSYRRVGPDSQDKELQDIYRMLPEDTKQAIRDIWGTDYMMVRSDLMDINFGYRKVSMTDAFHKEHKDVADHLFTGLWSHVWGEKAEYNIRRAEDVWQEIVAETKEILVIKNLSTLIGNIGSNISLLYWQGVPLTDMARYHRIAVKGVSNYRADSAELIELETKLAAGIITTSRREMEAEITRLQAALDHNPVKELIDAGLMPSIVEDISPDDDMYSYKSRLANYVGEHTTKVNKGVLTAARTVYMAKDTKMYKALRHATQLSDFVARYALYAHVTTRKDNPLSKEDAVQLASDSFVNYDLPSHRKLQYMNDMGFVQFTKYYLRIQKVIANLYAENPGRALALLATDAFFSQAPMLTDSGFTHRLGNNPFTLGALNYPGVLDELATIKLASSIVH